MYMKRRFYFIVTLALVACLCAGTADARKKAKKVITPEEEIAAQLRQYMDTCRTAGMSVVLVKGDKVVYQAALGYRDLATKDTLELTDIFRIASISKSFSAVSTLQLQAAGKLSLDDDVNKYLPFSLRNPRYPDIPITIKQMLSHTTSMNDYGGASWYHDDRYVNPARTTADTIAKVFFDYAPGWGFKYSNRGLNLMGMVIEKASGERFDNYVRQHILLPMGITNAGFNLDSLDKSSFTRLYTYNKKADSLKLAAGYIPSNEKKLADGTYRPVLDACDWSPTGGMKISAPDLAKWMMTIRDNGVAPNGVRILSEADAIKMKTPVTPPDKSRNWQYYCLNLIWQTNILEGRTLIGHTGSAQGLKSFMYFDKDSDWGIVGICSSDNNASAINPNGISGGTKIHYDVINYLFNRFKDTLLAE